MSTNSKRTGRTWTEQFEVTGNELLERVRELVREGNVRRVIVSTPSGRKLVEFPLTAGVAVGAVATIASPVWTLLGAFAAALARVRIEVVRKDTNAGT